MTVNRLGIWLCTLWTGAVMAGPSRLALNWKPEPQFGGFYHADQGGLFKKRMLNVQILPGGSGTPTVQMLMAGQTEYAVVSADEIILARDRAHGAPNAEIVALFAAYQTNPQCLMAHGEKKYARISDIFADAKALLLWQAGLPYAQFLKKMAQPLRARTAPYLGGLGSFIHDPEVVQQCFAASEPVAARRANLPIKVFMVAEMGYNPYTTVLATTRAHLKAHPNEVRDTVAAVRQGWFEYLSDPSATNEYMRTLNPAMDARTFTEGAKAQESLVRTGETGRDHLGIMAPTRWQQLVDQMFDLKLIRSKPNAGDLFENL
jgi:NitT/TauT family transport system substrate-binding protein